MFWGLVLEPGKKYAQTVSKPFHISMATLDVVHSENDLLTVNVNFQNADFILCNLQKNKILQTSLDLNFEAGDKIAFYTSGKGRVHLTGYLIDDDDVDEDDDLGIDAEAEESEDDVTPQKNAIKANKQEKRKSAGQTPGKPALKKSKMESEDEDGDDDDDDDGDSDLESLGDSDEEMEVESGEEDEDDDDDDGGEEDEEDSELEGSPPQKQQEKKKEKQQSAQKQQQNKQANTPNEMKKKKGKGHDATTTPTIQANGTPESQSGKKNKKKGGEMPGDKGANTPKAPQAGSPANTPQKKILEGGVAVEDTVVGSGPVAKPGRFVTVYYTGRLKQNNKKFDETVQGPGFKFRLGKGEVIKGWDIGVTGMKVGGKRKLIIPPHMAYGAKGSPPVIPPNSALVFEVELKNVN